MTQAASPAEQQDRFVRSKELRAITGLSATTLWRLERAKKLPPRRKVSEDSRTVVWSLREITEWMQSRPRVDADE